MRRILLIVAILLIATPAFAAITVNAKHIGMPFKTNIDCRTVEVNYVCSAGERVRAFALDVSLSNPNYRIISISDFNVGESNHVGNGVGGPNQPPAKPGYGIFPGKFRDVVNPADVNWGIAGYNPIAPATDADAAGTGLDTNRIIVELGSLYVGDNNKPPSSGTLFRIRMSGPVQSSTNILLSANATRGGVVLEDGTTAAGVTFNGQTSTGFPECFPCGVPYNLQYAQFIDGVVGKPNCWCGQYAVADANWKYQCYGDADGKVEGLNKYRIYTSDYNKLVANWRKKATQLKAVILGAPGECTDFDHQLEGLNKYRVYTSDYNRLVANWRKKDTQMKGAMCPGPNGSSIY